MLSLHGLVIIATDPTIYETENGGFIQFQIASETWDKKTCRYFMRVWVHKDRIKEEFPRFQRNCVIEIVRGTLNEVPSKLENPNKFCTAVILQARLDDIRILKIPFFYDGLKGITLQEKPEQKQEESQ
jgi:hypothetical protein